MSEATREKEFFPMLTLAKDFTRRRGYKASNHEEAMTAISGKVDWSNIDRINLGRIAEALEKKDDEIADKRQVVYWSNYDRWREGVVWVLKGPIPRKHSIELRRIASNRFEKLNSFSVEDIRNFLDDFWPDIYGETTAFAKWVRKTRKLYDEACKD